MLIMTPKPGILSEPSRTKQRFGESNFTTINKRRNSQQQPKTKETNAPLIPHP